MHGTSLPDLFFIFLSITLSHSLLLYFCLLFVLIVICFFLFFLSFLTPPVQKLYEKKKNKKWGKRQLLRKIENSKTLFREAHFKCVSQGCSLIRRVGGWRCQRARRRGLHGLLHKWATHPRSCHLCAAVCSALGQCAQGGVGPCATQTLISLCLYKFYCQ